MRNLKPFLAFLAIGAFFVASIGRGAVRVVVDAGHGGSDAGLRTSGQNEKSWDLKFAVAFAKALNDAGLESVSVRSKDDEVHQDKRFEVVNTAGASLAVIFHVDMESSGKIGGPFFVVQPPQTNVSGPEDGLPEAGTIPLGRYRQSLRLARLLAGAVGASQRFSPLSETRAVGTEGTDPKGCILAVPHESLRYAAIPAVVVMPLFMSRKEDLQRFSTDESIASFCKALAQGVVSYLHGDGK